MVVAGIETLPPVWIVPPVPEIRKSVTSQRHEPKRRPLEDGYGVRSKIPVMIAHSEGLGAYRGSYACEVGGMGPHIPAIGVLRVRRYP
jgi:hypothetical protein